MDRRRPAFLLAFAVAAGTFCGRVDGGEPRFAPERVNQALVEVLVDGHLACSGFFIAENGTLLTCAHAVAGTRRIELLLAGGRRVAATRGGGNESIDAAVLFAELPAGEKAPSLGFAGAEPRVGQALFLAGSPFFRHRLFLPGMFAGGATAFEYNPDLKTYAQVTYVSAMTPRGTSGGPWLDEAGEVVGLQSGGIAKGDTFWGVAFMVPAALLRTLAEKPREPVVAGDLGAAFDELWELPEARIRRFSPEAREGLVLSRLLRGGACHACGLSRGDLVVKIEDRPCRFREDLIVPVRARRPGESVKLEVVRERRGRLVRDTVSLELGSSAETLRLEEL